MASGRPTRSLQVLTLPGTAKEGTQKRKEKRNLRPLKAPAGWSLSHEEVFGCPGATFCAFFSCTCTRPIAYCTHAGGHYHTGCESAKYQHFLRGKLPARHHGVYRAGSREHEHRHLYGGACCLARNAGSHWYQC